MSYPPPPPNCQDRLIKKGEFTLYRFNDEGMWLPMEELNRYHHESAYCIAIVGWQREAVKLATRGDMAGTETAGENADAWLRLLEVLK